MKAMLVKQLTAISHECFKGMVLQAGKGSREKLLSVFAHNVFPVAFESFLSNTS
jgi:hypothetical protein